MLTIKTFTPERIIRLSREGIWIACGQAAAFVGALVGVRLLTELLDPAAYGELALGMTAATLVNQVVLGPLGNGAMRFYAPAVERGDVGGYLVAVRHLLLRATGAIGLILLGAVAGLVVIERPDLIGKTHYLLKALLDKGLVKAKNFRRSGNKIGYLYVLTPTGMREKMRMTKAFLRRKEADFEALRRTIAALKSELAERSE